jgi:hypothetical protein
MSEIHVSQDKVVPDAWRVEHRDADDDRACAVTIFAGYQAERRAREYAERLKTRGTPFSSVDAKP